MVTNEIEGERLNRRRRSISGLPSIQLPSPPARVAFYQLSIRQTYASGSPIYEPVKAMFYTVTCPSLRLTTAR